jgi:hypothetical protein
MRPRRSRKRMAGSARSKPRSRRTGPDSTTGLHGDTPVGGPGGRGPRGGSSVPNTRTSSPSRSRSSRTESIVVVPCQRRPAGSQRRPIALSAARFAKVAGLAGTTTVRSDATRSRSGFAVEGVSVALCALVAVIGTEGQRAGRPSGDVSREGGRTPIMLAERPKGARERSSAARPRA